MTDGTSHDVSRIDFKVDKVDLYLVSGQKLRVSSVDIDYAKSGFKRPDAAITTIYGVAAEAPSKGPTQSELETMWNQAHQTMVASNDFGSLVKGETVKVIESSQLTTVVVAKDATTGLYKRIVVDNSSYLDNFEEPAVAGQPRKTQPITPTKPTTSEPDLTFTTPEGNASFSEIPEETGPTPVLIKIGTPIAVAFVVGLILIFVTHGAARLGVVVALLAVCGYFGINGYHAWMKFQQVDEAEQRVSIFLTNFLDLSDDDRVDRGVSMWSRGTFKINNPTELAAAKSECLRWLEKGRIGIFKAFKVKGGVLQEDNSSVVVFVTIDDQLKKMLVSHDQSLSWAK